jgi:hypothetical protein
VVDWHSSSFQFTLLAFPFEENLQLIGHHFTKRNIFLSIQCTHIRRARIDGFRPSPMDKWDIHGDCYGMFSTPILSLFSRTSSKHSFSRHSSV